MKQKSLHPLTRKIRTGKRRKGILWEYNGDGQFYKERIGKFFKQYWKKWDRREINRYYRGGYANDIANY